MTLKSISRSVAVLGCTLAAAALSQNALAQTVSATCPSTLSMVEGQDPTGSVICTINTTTGTANFRVDNVPLYMDATPLTGTATTTPQNVTFTFNAFGKGNLVPGTHGVNMAFFNTTSNTRIAERPIYGDVLNSGPPPNDEFANALNFSLAAGTAVASNITATTQGGEGNFRSVWWNFTPTASGQYAIDTVGSFSRSFEEIDTVLDVGTGTSFATLVPVASNDDLVAGRLISGVVINATAGTTYRIRVATKATSAANGFGLHRLNIQAVPASNIVATPDRPYTVAGEVGSFLNGGGRTYYVTNLSAGAATVTPTTTTGGGYTFTPASASIAAGASARFRMDETGAAAATAGAFLHAINFGNGVSIPLRRSVNTVTPGVVLVASILPTARTRAFGQEATAFATILNAGTVPATGCQISGGTGTYSAFNYQRTDASNLPTGTQNEFVNIPAGGAQSFVFAMTPTARTDRSYNLAFDCANSRRADPIPGVNTFLMSNPPTQPADMVTIGATPTADGILNVPLGGASAMALASINIGTSATVNATVVDTLPGSTPANLPLTMQICRSNPTTGVCTSTLGTTTSLGTLAANEVVTMSLFVTSNGTAIPLDPATKRIFVFLGDTNTTFPVGGTSVAVRTTSTDAGVATASK